MNIFGNLIKDTEIIGIGDLNAAETTPGSASTQIVEYSFRVFTKASAISIYSPQFSKTQTVNADAWLKKYMAIREQISTQIGELQPNS